MSIDTLEYVKTLENAGVERKVAEAHVKAMNQHVLPELATRHDLEQMEQRLGHRIAGVEQKIAGVEQKLDQKIETMVQRMEATVWKAAIATMGGVIAIGSLLVRFLR
jgi:type II secretory pathway predicted ATPase ExeA